MCLTRLCNYLPGSRGAAVWTWVKFSAIGGSHFLDGSYASSRLLRRPCTGQGNKAATGVAGLPEHHLRFSHACGAWTRLIAPRSRLPRESWDHSRCIPVWLVPQGNCPGATLVVCLSPSVCLCAVSFCTPAVSFCFPVVGLRAGDVRSANAPVSLRSPFVSLWSVATLPETGAPPSSGRGRGAAGLTDGRGC